MESPTPPPTCPSRLRRTFACVVALTLASAVFADDKGDHDKARRAMLAGEVLPLSAVLDKLAAIQPGQVLEVELDNDHGRWVYEIKLLQTDGKLLRIDMDARQGTVLRSRLKRD